MAKKERKREVAGPPQEGGQRVVEPKTPPKKKE